jgi:hypothetical protein
VDYELEMIWEEAVVVYLKVLYQYLHGVLGTTGPRGKIRTRNLSYAKHECSPLNRKVGCL